MSVTTGWIQNVAGAYLGIAGRKFIVTPGMFKISADSGGTWETLTSLGPLTDTVNCTYLSGGATARYLMINPGVESFSFKMENDTSNPKEVMGFSVKPSLSLPGISTTRIRNVLGEDNNSVSSLLTSDNLNPCSPFIPRADVYIPSSVDINTLPETVGNSDKTVPHRLGEMVGYCHTATAGFRVNGWDSVQLPYNIFPGNDVTTLTATVIWNDIPVSGDLNNDKWARVKIEYGSLETRDNLDFRTLAVDRFIDESVPVGSYTLNVDYWNGSGFTNTFTKSATVSQQTISEYIEDTLKTEFGFTITNANYNSKAVTFTRTVKNLDSVPNTVGECEVLIAGSPISSRIHLNAVYVGAGQTYTETGLYTIWDDVNEADFQRGDYVHLNAYLTETEDHYFMSSNSLVVT